MARPVKPTKDTERVQKTLSNSGYCSRRKAEELIDEGRVTVNGQKITLGDQAGKKDNIAIDGVPLKKEQPIYIVFHKPTGCVTALTDERYRTIMHYIKCNERVFPVGRLDMDTSGLLLLTNDGTFANKILHPSYEIKKTYVADLDAPIGPRKMAMLERGVDLVDGKTSPAKVRRINPEKIEITIHEGKNRIVRRMLEALGYTVLRLHRTKIGLLDIGKLKEGKHKRFHEPPQELLESIRIAQEELAKNPRPATKKKTVVKKEQKTPYKLQDKFERTKVPLPKEVLKTFGFKEGQAPKSSLPKERPHKTNTTPNPNNKLYAERKRNGGVPKYVPQKPGTRKKPRPRPAPNSFSRQDSSSKRFDKRDEKPKRSYRKKDEDERLRKPRKRPYTSRKKE